MAYKLYPHQQELIDKAQREFQLGKKSVLIVSPAGSGKSIMIADIINKAIKKGGHVLFMVHRKELVEQIQNTLKENNVDLSQVDVMTVGKIKSRQASLKTPTLIVTDETHHSLAKTYLNIYKYYKDVPRIGFTATPWRMSGKGFNNIYESMVEGKSVQWLIDHHYLAPFDYYSINIANQSKLKRSSTGDYTSNSIDDAMETAIFGDVVKTYLDKAKGTQAIIYAYSVEYSKAITQEFINSGINAKHVDATTPAKDREKTMQDFKNGKLNIISNVDLISEGFNVPDCQTVILIRPTASLVIDVQQSMRSMRYKKGKRAIIIDHVGNYMQFGLPNTPRKWSLQGRKKNNTKSETPTKVCPMCFAVVKAQVKYCPICSHEFEIEERKALKQDSKAEVVKIASNSKIVISYKNNKDPRNAKSYQELQEIARERNYKPGWAYYQAKNRHFI